MKKRMNKNDLLELIKTLKIDKEEFWILSSGALVLRDIYPDAGDLDIAVTNKGLEQLKKNYNLKQKENGWYIVNDKIECVCDGEKEDLEYQPELIENYYVQNINEYLEYLETSTREKDKLRIPIVKEYVKKTMNSSIKESGNNYNVIFESENIIYVNMSESLFNDYLIMYNNLAIQKTIFKKEYTKEQILNWLKKQLTSEDEYIFSMIEKDTNEYIGNVEIIKLGNNIGEIVISITPKKQGMHYGTEAIREIVKYGYENLGLEGLELDVYKDNLRAIHCYEKVGFELDKKGHNDNAVHMKHKR